MRHAHTLIEMVMAMVVISIIAASFAPIANAVADGYASSSSAREATERTAYAIDRVVRLLRETPEGATAGVPDITRAETDAVEFGDGRAVALVAGNLELTSGSGVTAVLCRDVDVFRIDYLGDDGITDTSSNPEDTRRYMVRLGTGGLELRSSAYVRIAMVTP